MDAECENVKQQGQYLLQGYEIAVTKLDFHCYITQTSCSAPSLVQEDSGPGSSYQSITVFVITRSPAQYLERNL